MRPPSTPCDRGEWPGWFALALSAALALPAGAGAQSPFDASLRVAPQRLSYRFGAPVSQTVSQTAVPVAVVIPFGPRLFVDIATAYASTEVSGSGAGSRIEGLADTQVRATYTFGTDAVVVTGGLNLPTGQATVTDEQIDAAGRIGSDFLLFPISNMGTGFGATAGLGVARTLGRWNLGAGVSARHSAEYEPFDIDGQRPRFQPGSEIRLRIGGDREVAAGRLVVGATWAAFGDDQAGTFTYSTGDRWIAQGGYHRRVGTMDVGFGAWNLLRTEGRAAASADSSVTTPWENIASVSASIGFGAGGFRIEPDAEVRFWTRGESAAVPGGTAGRLARAGVRVPLRVLGMNATPSVGVVKGRLDGVAGGASLDGVQAAVVLTPGR